MCISVYQTNPIYKQDNNKIGMNNFQKEIKGKIVAKYL